MITDRERQQYRSLVRHYEACLEKHGDSHLGVDWPNAEDAKLRYRVMLDLIQRSGERPVTLLDFGCGTSGLLDYMREERVEGVAYSGLDVSPKFIEVARNKYPDVEYFCMDVLDDAGALPNFDYVVMNGVFTEKLALSFETMSELFKQLVGMIFERVDVGLAFNVMTKLVAWERTDLFHMPFDMLAEFLIRDVSRHFLIRSDYGLYEYTAYVYRSNEGMLRPWRT